MGDKIFLINFCISIYCYIIILIYNFSDWNFNKSILCCSYYYSPTSIIELSNSQRKSGFFSILLSGILPVFIVYIAFASSSFKYGIQFNCGIVKNVLVSYKSPLLYIGLYFEISVISYNDNQYSFSIFATYIIGFLIDLPLYIK